MDPYFVVLELPDSCQVPEGEKYTDEICATAVRAIDEGVAKVISVRNDTGISEELRNYALYIKRFTTFLLFQVNIEPAEFSTKHDFYKKIAQWLRRACSMELVHAEDNYQLIAIEA